MLLLNSKKVTGTSKSSPGHQESIGQQKRDKERELWFSTLLGEAFTDGNAGWQINKGPTIRTKQAHHFIIPTNMCLSIMKPFPCHTIWLPYVSLSIRCKGQTRGRQTYFAMDLSQLWLQRKDQWTSTDMHRTARYKSSHSLTIRGISKGNKRWSYIGILHWSDVTAFDRRLPVRFLRSSHVTISAENSWKQCRSFLSAERCHLGASVSSFLCTIRFISPESWLWFSQQTDWMETSWQK